MVFKQQIIKAQSNLESRLIRYETIIKKKLTSLQIAIL